jgi:hypothetical protein
MYTCIRVGSMGGVRPQARYQLYLFAQPDPFQSASCPHLVPMLRIEGASQPRPTHSFTECSVRQTAYNFAEHQFISSMVVTVSFLLYGSRDTLKRGPAVGCPKYQRRVLIISYMKCVKSETIKLVTYPLCHNKIMPCAKQMPKTKDLNLKFILQLQ